MKTTKILGVIFYVCAFCLILTTKTYASGSITLTPASGNIPKEGLEVDIIVEDAPNTGVEFSLIMSGNAKIEDISKSTGKTYIYSPSATDITNGLNYLATNLNGDGSSNAKGLVGTFKIVPTSTSGTVTITFSNTTESNIEPAAITYTYTISGSNNGGNNSSNSDNSNNIQPVTPASGNGNLPSTGILDDISTRRLLIIGAGLLICGELLSPVSSIVRSIFKKKED